MAQRTWGRELAGRDAPWQKRAGCWQQRTGVGDADGREEETGREEAKGGGVEADGHRTGAEKNKNQTNKTTRRLGRGDMEKRTGEGKGEATVQRNAAQAAVRSGFRVAGRGGAAHPPHPSTHHG